MQLYNDKKKRVGVLKDFANRSITSTLDTGDKELAFEYPADGPMVEELREECYIRTKTDEFVLKAVERGEKKNKYTATLNVEDLEGAVFPGGFETVELTITDALNFAFKDTGWKVGTCEITKRRTIRIEESTTAWAVLQQSLSTYRCECKIDSLTKTVNIYEQVGEDKGCYFMDGLNLRKLTLKSDTYDFYTRIYPIGKDGLTPFEALNVPYIENHQYSEKVKSYVWKDERYTRTTSLIEDATAKIEEMSRPYKAFTADVVDLAKRSKKYKNILSYGIGDTITLIAKKNRVKEKQRIVKITEYPEHPEKNTVEISNARKTFAEIQKSEAELSKTEAIDVSNTVTKKILENGYYTKTEVESCIAATEKKITLSVGETYITKETYADGITEVKKDATAKAEKAEAAAKADTTNRLKSYSTTEEMKAAIELAAEGITSTVSKTYVTQAIYEKGIEDAKTDATTKANAAAKDAKADTASKLKSYSTTTQMNTAIKQAADSITSTVSKTYTTIKTYEGGIADAKADATTKANAAEAAAKADTTARLKSYSTTTEMNSAIEQAANSITLKVSEKYTEKTVYENGIANAKADATTKANAAEAAAKADTANQLKSYSTTKEMNAAIKLATDAIELTIDNKIESIQVGGRNLVKNSYKLDGQWSAAGGFVGSTKVVEDTDALSAYHIETSCTTAGSGPHYPVFSKKSNRVGKTYTWSFWAKCSVEKTGSVGHECGGQKKITVTTEWKKFSHTWKYTDGQYSSFTFYLGFKAGEVLYIRDFKIEEGTEATSWSPAPEDIDASVAAVDGKFASYSTTTQMNTAIKQATDSITSTVSKTYVTQTTYEGGIADAKADATTKANNALSSAKSDATTKANNAEANAKNDTANKLKSYSTTTQMNTAIKQATDSITSTVSKTYVTQTTYEGGIADAKADATTKANNALSSAKSDATTKANNAEANAKNDTANKLKSYSTTTQMNTAIKQSAAAINLEVEKKTDSDTVKSLISQAADSIRLKAAKISWSSTYSSMTEAGKLTCTSADITGDVTTKQAWNKTYKITELKQGVLKGYMGDTQTGLLDMSAWYTDELRHTALKGFDWLHLQAGITAIVEVSDGSFEVQSDKTKIYGATSVSVVGDDITCSASSSVTVKSDRGTATIKGKLVQIWGDTTKMYNLPHVTSGGHVVFGSDGQTLSYLASSSKRYKDHVAEITEEEARKILEIKPVWFRYKDGYLTEKDPLNGEQIPGFYAEDVEEAMPVIAWKNENGQTENWDERKLLPFMLFLIQELYRRTEKNESHAGN